MLAKYKWYRKLRGGYWIYCHFIGWNKANKHEYAKKWIERGAPFSGLEDYVN